MAKGPVCVLIRWAATPLRGDQFAEAWMPHAEAVLRYGAHSWAFYRALDGLHDFVQIAYFDSKLDFDRYWYSEEIAEARVETSGLYQVPLLPAFFEVAGEGAVSEERVGETG